MLIIGQGGLEGTPIITTVPHHFQVFNQAIEPFGRLCVTSAPDISQDFIGLRCIGIKKPAFVLFPLTDERPELVDDHAIIMFLQRIDHELSGPSSEAARHRLRAHGQDIGAIAETAAASEHVESLSLAGRIGPLVEVLILELLATAAAEQILGPDWLFAIFDYFIGEAVGAMYFAGYFAHIHKV